MPTQIRDLRPTMTYAKNQKGKQNDGQSQSSANVSAKSEALIADNRPQATAQRKLQAKADASVLGHSEDGLLSRFNRQPQPHMDIASPMEQGSAQLISKSQNGNKELAHDSSEPAQRKESNGLQSVHENERTVQRAGIWEKFKASLSIKSVALGIEGLGHVVAGIVAVAAGGAAAASLVGVAPGTIAIVGGVGQILIGVSKWVRGSIVGWANLQKDKETKDKAKPWIDGLTAFEAAIGVSSTVVTAGAAALVGAIIGGISSLIKLIRASMSLVLNKKLPGWVVALEGALGTFAGLATVIQKGASGAVDVIKTLVNYLKTFRGVATADDAAGPEEKKDDSGS